MLAPEVSLEFGCFECAGCMFLEQCDVSLALGQPDGVGFEAGDVLDLNHCDASTWLRVGHIVRNVGDLVEVQLVVQVGALALCSIARPGGPGREVPSSISSSRIAVFL